MDLFASILKREDGRYYLVTPVEKVGITVEDAPLFAWDVEVEGEGRDQTLIFTTRTGDVVTAGPGHEIRVERDSETGEPSPYIHVRRGLYAKIDRKTFYRLVDIGAREPLDGEPWFGLWSSNVFFPVIPTSELP